MLPELVLAAIRRQRPSGAPTILLACSGGIDSQVLMHAAAAVWPAKALVVAHVHHGLQPEADAWLDFCQGSARRLGLQFLSHRLPPLPLRQQGGVEAWARRLRYRALAELAGQAGASIVLTAHHANDQLETHRLRRIRGAGPLGLAAMREDSPLPGAPERLLLRPFLHTERPAVVDYARRHHLEWVDDPSNQDLRYARNRVRQELAKALLLDPDSLQRGLVEIGGFQGLADAARHQASVDLAACRLHLAPGTDRRGEQIEATPGAGASLSRASLARLAPERAEEAIRLWLAQSGCRMPSRAKLAEVLRQLVDGRSAHARLHHDGSWLLRYRDRIDTTRDLPAPLTPAWFRWSGEALVSVAGQRYLFHRAAADDVGLAGQGIDAQLLASSDLLMDRAHGADRLRPAGSGCRRTWKNLSQERGLPPWLRAAMPVLRLGGDVIHAAPFGMNQDFTAADPAPATEPAGVDRPGHSFGQSSGRRVAIEWLAPPQLTRWL